MTAQRDWPAELIDPWLPHRRVWGRKVRLKGGTLTHWAGRDQDGTTMLAHRGYAWTSNLCEPLEDGRACRRCIRNQPFFIKIGDA